MFQTLHFTLSLSHALIKYDYAIIKYDYETTMITKTTKIYLQFH
jgi:hypothetical protein